MPTQSDTHILYIKLGVNQYNPIKISAKYTCHMYYTRIVTVTITGELQLTMSLY